MRKLLLSSRYLIYIAVIGLLIAALAVFLFAGVATLSTIVGSFGHGEFNAEGARAFSVDLIEMIDLFLLGTILLITSVGLYELFLDPGIGALIPEWLSVTNLEQLKFNLLAVVIVMLAILFLSTAAGDLPEGTTIIQYGGSAALVIAALSLAVFVFGRITRRMEAHKEQERREALGPAHEGEGRGE
jgi:uncharacterized membrane protein YqhA